MGRRARWWVGGTAVAALAVAMTASALRAKPGVVTDNDDKTYTGDVDDSDPKVVTVGTPGGKLILQRAFVKRINFTGTVDDQYDARHAKLGPDDAKGRVALGQWANEHSRADLAVKALEEATKIEPTNRQASLDLATAKRQLELDRAGKRAATKPATAAGGAAGAGPHVDTRRQLTNEEINVVRQHELTADDAGAKVRFENGVVKRYVAAGGLDAATFDKLTPAGQALAILAGGDGRMAHDVRVLTDPAPVVEFKQKVMPIIARGCGSTACHGGVNGGTFGLFSGETPAATYSNYYVLQTYAATIGGIKYNLLDRVTPERSLALQFGLPMNDGNPPHPKVAEFHARFKSKADPAYAEVLGWLKAFAPLAPDYGINVSPYLVVEPAAPATRPATAPTTRPTDK